MFTGLIEELGSLVRLTRDELVIKAEKIGPQLKTGDSVAVNGICLTVTRVENHHIHFHYSSTTRALSCFRDNLLKTGDRINLERALQADSRLHGHIVQGHIDGKARIIDLYQRGEDIMIEFLIPEPVRAMIVKKGSVALDGISLTVSEVLTTSFKVTVIPHTLKITNLRDKKVGDFMHLEVDLFARYIKNFLTSGGSYEKY